MSGLLVSLQGAVAQGVLWGIMVLGVYITFRLMDIADMTVDGSFALGACVCAVLVVNKGVNPVLALLVAAAAGVVAGAVTGILHTVFEIPVSGTSDLTPVKEQIDLMQQIIPDVKKVGLLYCSAEANSVLQIDMAKEALDTAGIEYEDYTVSNSNEIPTVVESMVGNVDCVYTPTDNMIAAGMATVTMVTNENKLPVICGEKGMVDAGGLATYGIDYYQLGYMTGEQAVKILTEGADISKMPIGYLDASKCELSVNEETAQTLGIDVSGLEK